MTNSPNASIMRPAESVPVCPFFKITLVEATFNPNLKTVAKRRTVGKLEKSRGLKVCNATIKTSNEIKRLEVNNTSKNNGLNGMTIIAIRIIIPMGILNVHTKLKKFSFSNVFKTKSIIHNPISQKIDF